MEMLEHMISRTLKVSSKYEKNELIELMNMAKENVSKLEKSSLKPLKEEVLVNIDWYILQITSHIIEYGSINSFEFAKDLFEKENIFDVYAYKSAFRKVNLVFGRKSSNLGAYVFALI